MKYKLSKAIKTATIEHVQDGTDDGVVTINGVPALFKRRVDASHIEIYLTAVILTTIEGKSTGMTDVYFNTKNDTLTADKTKGVHVGSGYVFTNGKAVVFWGNHEQS